jgi:hypothetical protein
VIAEMDPLNPDIKLCQSCIERGFNPPNPATREWAPKYYVCDDCYQPLLNNLINIAPAEVQQLEKEEKIDISSPILKQIFELLNIPEELRFNDVDTTCRNYDKIFNFHAPAVVNYNDIKSLADEIEQRSAALFQIKYSIEPLQFRINKLKEERRKEKGLKDYSDSKEEYAKAPGKKKSSQVKQTQEEKMAKTLGMTVEAYREVVKKAREKEFNKMAGNCPECGSAMPCVTHSVTT